MSSGNKEYFALPRGFYFIFRYNITVTVPYVYNIIKFKKWNLLLSLGTFLLVLRLRNFFITLFSITDNILELDKCPACYGFSACDYVHNIDITPYDIFTAFSYLFGIKNVFFGNLGQRKLVLKKLAHSSELNDFDHKLCEENNLLFLCKKNAKDETYKQQVNFYELIKKELTFDFHQDDFSRLRLCPTTKCLDNLFYNIYFNNEKTDREHLLINIWTLVSVNPEPLLLQILPADKGWPVPKYLGACGRVVVEEYVGPPLSAYYNAPWTERARIASSLLNAAYMFTFRSKDFSFYLTDVSADNIAVDLNLTAKFIDLENVIVVAKNCAEREISNQWHEFGENTADFDCFNCFAFSAEDICNHKINDHNYYAICSLLLSLESTESSMAGGLLHDIPLNVLQQSNITYLIQQCVVPEPSNNRISTGQELKNVLDAVLES